MQLQAQFNKTSITRTLKHAKCIQISKYIIKFANVVEYGVYHQIVIGAPELGQIAQSGKDDPYHIVCLVFLFFAREIIWDAALAHC